MFRVKEHRVPAQHIRGYPHATRHAQEEVLHIVVKQYIPLSDAAVQQDAVTIIGAHANGFPKEVYEPLWEEILQRATAAGFAIRGMWIADIASQGGSGVLNEGKLGNEGEHRSMCLSSINTKCQPASWFDHSRDLLHMVNHFRSEMPRPLFAIGHSLGGANLVNLALIHPRLFEGQILIDPVIQRREFAPIDYGPTFMSSIRRDVWPSREAAKTSFLRSKFYQAWDSRVLNLYIKYGLRDLPTEIYPQAQRITRPDAASKQTQTMPPSEETNNTRQVTLTTTKHNEVYMFLRPNFELRDGQGQIISDPEKRRLAHPDLHPYMQAQFFYRPEAPMIFSNLPYLRPSVLYIFGQYSELSAPALEAEKLSATGTDVGGSGGVEAGRVKGVTIKKAGHLIPMQRVAETAEACAQWLGEEMKRWRENEAWLKTKWAETPENEKYTLSKKHLEILKRETILQQEKKKAQGKSATDKVSDSKL